MGADIRKKRGIWKCHCHHLLFTIEQFNGWNNSVSKLLKEIVFTSEIEKSLCNETWPKRLILDEIQIN